VYLAGNTFGLVVFHPHSGSFALLKRDSISLHRTRVAWRCDAIEGEPQHPWVAVAGECHGPPSWRLGFAVELGGKRWPLRKWHLRDPPRLNLQDRFRYGWVFANLNPPHLAPIAGPPRPSGAGPALIDTNACRSPIMASRAVLTLTFFVRRCPPSGSNLRLPVTC
jgi:hypothetical protein